MNYNHIFQKIKKSYNADKDYFPISYTEYQLMKVVEDLEKRITHLEKQLETPQEKEKRIIYELGYD